MVATPVSEIIATTLRNRSGKLADNVTKNNALLTRLQERGNIEIVDGGRTIFRELEYAENSTFMYYSGYDVLNIAPSDVFTAAEYDWKQCAVNITASGLEVDVQNAGEEQVIPLLKSRIKNGEKTMKNNMSAGIYSDGTGSGGKQIGGMQFLVDDSPATGVVGGIDAASFSFWRNQKVTVAAFTATTIQGFMLKLWQKQVRGLDVPDLIVSDNAPWAAYHQSLAAIQRIQDQNSKMAKAGWQTLKYMGSDVVMDGGLQGSAPSNHMYFLNTDYLKLVVARKRNMVPLSTVRSINQDATVEAIVWAGNLAATNRELQGVLSA